MGAGGALVLSALAACAQTHVVHKPDAVVRAVGVYEWTGTETKPTASRFVPVSLFIDGHLQDAAVYLARPVPFALQTGTIFELEKAGVPQGTLEVAFSSHEELTDNSSYDDGWMAYGAFKPLLPLKEEPSRLRAGKVSQVEISGGKPHPSFAGGSASGKPATVPSTSTTEDNSVDPDRPTLTRKTGNPSDTPAATASAQPAPSTTPDTDSDADRPTLTRRTGSPSDTQTTQTPATTSSGTTASTPAADPDRPTMKRPSDSSTTSTQNSGESTPGGDDDPDRPTLRRRTPAQREAARKQHDSSSVTGGNASLNDDPDRPILHHGKEPGALDADDLPPLRGLPPGVHREVGVSDAANRPEHDFARPWEDDAERTAVLNTMRDLARPLVLAYARELAPVRASSAPHTSTNQTARHRAAAAKAVLPAAAVSWTDELLRGYTLSYGGAATYVYTAASPGPNGNPRYVTVVAQREPGGALKTAIQSVTDGTHLDRTPRMVLVDAVDAEASNRASLLFELRAQSTRQFALYRVIGAEAQQIFLSGSSD